MYRRSIGILICILLVSATASSVIGNKLVERTSNVVSYDRNILYVGGTGPNNYTLIQSAIDDASEGDTVYVYEGTYYEHIYINTTISLIGKNKGFTIINGSGTGNVVTVNAGYVNINGFTIEKSGNSFYGIEINSDYSNISDNIFDENGYGIYIIDADNHTITGNIFFYHRWRCIRAEYSNNNIISGNSFIDTTGQAIVILYCDFGIISDNLLNKPWNGIGASWCNYIVITDNTVIGRGRNQGISLSNSENCTISGNIVDYCDEGIRLTNSNHNNIYGNENTNCDYDGIFFYSNSNYNVISNNILSDNDGGITMWDFNSNNTIYSNTINSNSYGIYIKYQASSNDNNIYHNNLIDNNVNAFDGCSNIWNISYPSGGNYWDDYTGDDNNRGSNQDIPGSDGIGDTERNIPGGGSNKDIYPLMHPWGEQRPVANYTFIEEYGGYVFNASTSYDRDGEVVSYGWDFGDGTTAEGVLVAHSYNASGTYDITLIITDDEGYNGNLTKTIDINKNYPPETPSIDGPSSGKWGKPYHFTFQSSDNEGSEIWYFIDWGDGTPTSWMGPFASGDDISEPHTWGGSQETYIIKCKAKDMYDVESDWSEHEITIPRNRVPSYQWLEWLSDRYLLLEVLISQILNL